MHELTPVLGVGTARAVDYSLPSLWQAYQNDFTVGTFGDWSSQQALYHYRSNAIPKPSRRMSERVMCHSSRLAPLTASRSTRMP